MITGRGYWSKVTGSPRVNKFTNIPQWSFDLSVDQETADSLLAKGMKASYLRNKGDERGTFISFTRDAVKKDQSPGKPYRIVDSKGKPWDDKPIGNGSVLNVVVSLNERTFRGEKFLKPSAVALQVWELQEFSGGGFPIEEGGDDTEDEDSEDFLKSQKTVNKEW